MKKTFIVTILATFLLSCGVSKTIKQSKKTIKGAWLLDKISYSEAGTYNVTLLSDVTKTCFEESSWNFIPNNYTGSYIINGPDCETGERYFRFSIQEVDKETGLYDFLLKPTNKKYKSDEFNHGFRIKLAHLSDSSMQWQQSLSVEGKPFTITMHFSKTNISLTK